MAQLAQLTQLEVKCAKSVKSAKQILINWNGIPDKGRRGPE